MTLGGRFVFQRLSLPICSMGFRLEWVWLLITENLKHQSLKEDAHLFFHFTYKRSGGGHPSRASTIAPWSWGPQRSIHVCELLRSLRLRYMHSLLAWLLPQTLREGAPSLPAFSADSDDYHPERRKAPRDNSTSCRVLDSRKDLSPVYRKTGCSGLLG